MMAVPSLRERSGLEDTLSMVEESVIHPSIPAHEHPKIHALAEKLRTSLGIHGETSGERLKNIVGSIHNIVKQTAERKRMEYAEMGREEPVGRRPEMIASPPREVTATSGDVFDVGDLEGIRIGDDVFITVPPNKKVYLISKGMGIVGTRARRLDEVV